MSAEVNEPLVFLSPSEVHMSCANSKVQRTNVVPCPSDEGSMCTCLVIRDIDVENFKSYFGHHRIGPFHKTFTAVIGPNGSGKSNVIDAMLFVFGRSAKKIRLDKLSELIHNSAAHPNLTYASVTVNFVRITEPVNVNVNMYAKGKEKDISEVEFYKFVDQREEIVGSEFSITREVYRSGTSQYFIDGVRRSQKDVISCLIDQGVDLEHNRFLILQGEVEQIALMKPKAEKEGEEGLLEYLDDLIGTNEMIDAINTSTKRAEAAQLERMQTLDAEQKLKNEREALDAAKNSALAFVTKDNHLQKTLIVMCQLRMRGIEERLVEPRRLLKEIDNRIVAYEEEVHVRALAKSTAEEDVSKTKKEVYEVTKERDLARNKKMAHETELEQLKSGVDEQDRARRKIVENLKRSKENMQRALLQQQDAEREAAIHQQNLEEHSQLAESLRTQYEQLSASLLPQLKPLRQALEEKKSAFAPYEKKVTESTEKLNTARNQLDSLDSTLHKRAEQIDSIEQSEKFKIERLHVLVEHLQHAEHNNLHQQLASLQNTLAEVTRRKFAINTIIQEKKNLYSEGEADDRAMEFLLSQRSLKGYYGTLRQLGKIDEAYDIAAGIASNAWGFHVVQDRPTAVAALSLLKQHNMGRATMMVMSEIEREVGARVNKPFTSPNMKAKRLFDLIQPTNEKFKNVFYQAVRDTLVVSTLAEARETAFHSGNGNNNNNVRFRVVTLKGELVEPSGMITGGGSAPRGAKLKAARAPIDKMALRSELERLQQELIHTAEEERQLQINIHQLQSNAHSFTPEMIKQMRHEHRNLTASLENDKMRLDQLEKEQNALQKELQRKRQELLVYIANCEAELEEAESAKNNHHSAIAQLEAEIHDVGGESYHVLSEKLKTTNSKVDAEEEALRMCRRNAQKYRAVHERKVNDVAEYEQELAQAQAEAAEGAKVEIANCTARLEESTRQLHMIEAKLAKVQTSYEDARASLPIAHAAMVEAQKKLDDEQRYRQTESSKMADALQELAKFEQKIDGCEQKIRENVELYGLETLQLEIKNNRNSDDEDEHEEEDEENEQNGEYDKYSRSRNSDDSEEDEEGENNDDDEEEDEEVTEEEKSEKGHGNKRNRPKEQKDSAKIVKSKSNNNKKEKKKKSKTESSNDIEEEEENGEEEEEEKSSTNTDNSNRSSAEISGRSSGKSYPSTRSSKSDISHNEQEEKEQQEDKEERKDNQEEESNNENSNSNSVSFNHRHSNKHKKQKQKHHKHHELTLEDIRHMSFKVSPAELEECDYGLSVHLATALSEETKRLHSEIDFRAIALWRERDVAHRAARALYEEKKQIADDAESSLFELKERRRASFMNVFNHIRMQLKNVYQLLTHGGDADMELVDVNDPFEGVNFVVRPPKKSWKQISNLSGGEKTLSSLALIFALHHIKPTPIYVMDEIDAALDFRNVSIVANYVLRQASGAQFIIISLRNNMFEMAHQLVGVCKVHDVTSTLVLMPRAFQRKVENLIRASELQQHHQEHRSSSREKTETTQEKEGVITSNSNKNGTDEHENVENNKDNDNEEIQRFSHQMTSTNDNDNKTELISEQTPESNAITTSASPSTIEREYADAVKLQLELPQLSSMTENVKEIGTKHKNVHSSTSTVLTEEIVLAKTKQHAVHPSTNDMPYRPVHSELTSSDNNNVVAVVNDDNSNKENRRSSEESIT